MRDMLRIGDAVDVRTWAGNVVRSKVTAIELVEPGEKEGGVRVVMAPWATVNAPVNTVVVNLSNRHWAYGQQLVRVNY